MLWIIISSMHKNNIFVKYPVKTIVFFILFVFIVLDISVKFLSNNHPVGIYSPYYHHDLKKNARMKDKWGDRSYYINTNSLGFRDKGKGHIDVKNSSNKYRFLFIGDSFVEGIGLPYEKTFIGLLDNKLDNSKFEILNAGVRGYSPKLCYLKVKYLIEKTNLQFNELYMFIDISDIKDEVFYKDFVSPAPLTKGIDPFLQKTSFVYGFLRVHLLNEHNFIRFFKKNKKGPADNNYWDKWANDWGKWTYDKTTFDKWGTEGLNLGEENMNKLYNLCKKNDIKINIVVYPWPEQILNDSLKSIQVTFWETFSLKRNIDFISFFPAFIREANHRATIDKYFIKGDTHWNERGSKLIADTLLAKISG